MIQTIKDAIDSMDAVELCDKMNGFLAISPRQAIITINSANQDSAKSLIDKVAILLKDCPPPWPGCFIDYRLRFLKLN